MSGITFILTAWFAIEGVFGIGTTLSNRASTVWNTAQLKESIETFKNSVPEDTLAFGRGMPELCLEMHRDPKIAITDWSDMNHYSIEETERLVNECDSFVMMDGTPINVPSDFHEEAKITTSIFSCTYYTR